MLPESRARRRLRRISTACGAQHQRDLSEGLGRVDLPAALDRKYPNAATRMGLAVRVSRGADLPRPAIRTTVAASPARVRHPARGDRGGPPGGDREARQLPHLPPFLRDAPARGRLRHPDGAGAARPRGCQHDDDLHARPESGCPGRQESCRSFVAARAAVGCGRLHVTAFDDRTMTSSICRHTNELP